MKLVLVGLLTSTRGLSAQELEDSKAKPEKVSYQYNYMIVVLNN